MATTTTIIPEIPKIIATHFNKLEQQNTLLTNSTNLYKTLISHFTNLQNSIELKSQTLNSQFETLDFNHEQTLNSLRTREDSLPELLNSITTTIESQKSVALYEITKPIPNETTRLPDILKSMCRRMDPQLLMRLLVEKRRETTSLREKMAEAFSECVDVERFVIEAVKHFVEMKKVKKSGLIDIRWACSMVVRSLFPPEELKEGRRSGSEGLSRVFAKKAVIRAEEVLVEWKEVAEKEGGEGVGEGTGMGPAEAAMFIEVLLGFGLKERFEFEFYRKLMVEFCGRRDMAKLAIPIFGDKIEDLIEELVKNGKEVEAVYFASESGLTERFQPVSLLKSSLQKSKKDSADILKKGNNSSSSTDKANTLEAISIRSIIKCVEDHKLEPQFPVETLRKRLTLLEKAKNERKKGLTPSQSKRPHSSSTRARTSGPPTPRPSKIQKVSSPYTTFPVRDQVSPSQLSPVSRYLGPLTYPSQSTYPSQAYASSYGAPHVAVGEYGDSVTSTEARLGGSYGSQVGYAAYDYGAPAPATTTTPAYRHPSYPQ